MSMTRGSLRAAATFAFTCLMVAAFAGAGAGAEAEAQRLSAGCGGDPPVSPGQSAAASIDVDGLQRDYRVHVPAGYDAGQPIPLVLVLHGFTGTAEQTESEYTSFSEHADEHGYTVVYPQGTGFEAGGRMLTSWNDLGCNASPGPEGSICTEEAFDYPTPPECGESRECDWCTCNDDVGFIDALLDEIEGSVCVDLDRVYATGISNGGMFVHRLGCDLAERFAAIVPVAGTVAKGFNCAPGSSPKVSVMTVYGTSDRTVPYDGAPSSDGFLYTPTAQLMDLWAAEGSQQCAGEPSPYSTSKDGVQGLRCTQRAECFTGAEVVDCLWDGGHTWPRDGADPFGIDLIWEFFGKNGR